MIGTELMLQLQNELNSSQQRNLNDRRYKHRGGTS